MAAKPFLFNLSFMVLLGAFLSACSSGPGEEKFAPKILSVYTDVIHTHPSFYEKWPTSELRTLEFTLSLDIEDPQGLSDILKVYIKDLNEDWSWGLFSANDASPYNRCYKESGNFTCQFFLGERPDYLNIHNLEIVVQDKSGYTDTQRISFRLAGGEQADGQRFIYSAEYTGDTTGGYPALEAMTIADNALLFTADSGTQSFHIEFATSDVRAKEYSLVFYDNTSNPNIVGHALLNTSSIQSHPIIPGQTTTLELPWSEITFYSGFAADDITAMDITLFDNPIPWVVNDINKGIWFNHLATSELVQLSN